jgi:hypothetical protein
MKSYLSGQIEKGPVEHPLQTAFSVPPTQRTTIPFLWEEQYLAAPDVRGRLPQHLALKRRVFSWNDGVLHLVQGAPRTVVAQNGDGRLPSHLALAAGRGWDDCVCHLVKAAPHTLWILVGTAAGEKSNPTELATIVRLL